MSRHKVKGPRGIMARTMAFGMVYGNHEFEAWREGKGREGTATLQLSLNGAVREERQFRGPSAFGTAINQGMAWLDQEDNY